MITMTGLTKTVALLSQGLMAHAVVVGVNLLVIHSSTCIVSVGFSMVYTMGEDRQPTVSEAVSMSLGSSTAVTTPVVDIACVRIIPFHPNFSIPGRYRGRQ
jgi:hypothetical protein